MNQDSYLKAIPRPPLLSFVSDPILALLCPVVVYWVYSLFFHVLDVYDPPFARRHRLHTPKELRERNKVSVSEVVREVFLQHFFQTIIGLFFSQFEPTEVVSNHVLEISRIQKSLLSILPVPFAFTTRIIAQLVYWVGISCAKLFVATLILDSWQYFLHRLMHMNKYLYRTLHSRHHRLYVPYAMGALYNHPLEGLLMDTIGTVIAYSVAGLSTRERIIFFSFATAKTVDDHCGYNFPWDPMQFLFPNNASYHDIHHQAFGIKTNFSQPFFIFWDRILKTEYTGNYIPKNLEIIEKENNLANEITHGRNGVNDTKHSNEVMHDTKKSSITGKDAKKANGVIHLKEKPKSKVIKRR